MSHSLVFIEHLDEIDLLECLINSDTVVISMLPSVASELKRRDISFKTTLSFFGVKGHRKTIKKSFEIIEGLRPFLKTIKDDNVQYAYEKTWIFHFRFYLNYWFSMLCIIDNAVKKYKPDTLIAIRINFPKKSGENFFKKQYSINSILEEYASSHNIKIVYKEKNNTFTFQNYNWGLLKNWLKFSIFELQLSIFPLIRREKSPIVAPEDTYNMPNFLSDVCKNSSNAFPVYLSIQRNSMKTRIMEMLKGNEYSFLCIPRPSKLNVSSDFHEYLKISVSQIQTWLKKHPEILTIFGVNPNTHFLKYIENTLNHKMVDLNSEIYTLRRLLETTKPNKVFAQHSLGISYALGEICLQNDTPALLISHGSHVPHNNSLAELEWSIHAHTMINSHYPFVAIQSPWSKKFLNAQNGVISKGIYSGPLLSVQNQKSENNRQKLRKKIFANQHNKRIILHASSLKGWRSFRPWVFETFDEYIRNINDVIRALDSVPNSYLAIRFRPQEGISLKDLKSSLIKSDKYSIYVDGEFNDYLLASDLLLSYSSTTIEESLQNQIPVLQYDPDGKYEHIPAQELTASGKHNVSAIYSVMSKNNLIPGLLWWSEHHTEKKNQSISWDYHVLDYDNNMKWLSHMESTKC